MDEVGTTAGEFAVDVDIASLLLKRAAEPDQPALFVLPDRIEDGVGWYREDALQVPKALRALGVPSSLLHENSSDRSALSEYSASMWVAFAFGVSQNMTWDLAKATVEYIFAFAERQRTRDQSPAVRVKVARVERPDGAKIEGLEVEGPINDETAARIISAFMGSDSADA